jgi:hypothetical protein
MPFGCKSSNSNKSYQKRVRYNYLIHVCKLIYEMLMSYTIAMMSHADIMTSYAIIMMSHADVLMRTLDVFIE